MKRIGIALSLMACVWPWSLTALGQYAMPLDDASYADGSRHIFLNDEVSLIEVTMDPADLQAIVEDPFSDLYRFCSIRFANSMTDTVIDSVGIRARGNVARENTKFPWKLSFNHFVAGRKLHGLKKFNLLADANDPSISRSKLVWDTMLGMGVPACRTHYVWMSINDGALEGVYLSIEQVDDEFADAWFGNENGELYKCRHKGNQGANLKYIAPGSPEIYMGLGGGETYESEGGIGDFVLFADFVDFVNNTSDAVFAEEIGLRLNVDGLLRAMAVDMAMGQWDGYWIGGNNYYLYENQDTGRLEYVPWDLDHSIGQDYWLFPYFFGTNWATRRYQGWGNGGFGGGAPLVQRILEIEEYDAALLRYVHEAVEGPMGLGVNNTKIDGILELLGPLAFMGSFSGPTMDWNYTNTSFLNSFENPGNYSALNIPSTWGVRAFIRARTEHVQTVYDPPELPPSIEVNEIVALNQSTIQDEAGEYEDYVELYNGTGAAFDLSGMYLSDSAGEPLMWPIPPGTVIPPEDFLLFWCDKEPLDGPLHTSFKLGADGEGVWLFDRDEMYNSPVSHLHFPELAEDEAWGRFPDGAGVVSSLPLPTPGFSNSAGLPLDLIIDGDCPGRVDLYASGTEPGGTVAFVRASSAGSFEIPLGYPCAGTVLDLSGGVSLLGTRQSDSNGTAVFGGVISEENCGASYLQIIDLGTCTTSPVEVF